jgi:hypothetical protein
VVAVFEPTSPAVTLQRAPEVVRPDYQAKFPREIFADFIGTGAFGVRLHGLQGGITQRRRRTPRLLASFRFRPRDGRRGSFRHAPFLWLLGCYHFSAESTQRAFGDLQLTELAAQLCPLRIARMSR